MLLDAREAALVIELLSADIDDERAPFAKLVAEAPLFELDDNEAASASSVMVDDQLQSRAPPTSLTTIPLLRVTGAPPGRNVVDPMASAPLGLHCDTVTIWFTIVTTDVAPEEPAEPAAVAAAATAPEAAVEGAPDPDPKVTSLAHDTTSTCA